MEVIRQSRDNPRSVVQLGRQDQKKGEKPGIEVVLRPELRRGEHLSRRCKLQETRIQEFYDGREPDVVVLWFHYFPGAAVGTASTGDSNAMNKTQAAVPVQEAL